MKVKEQEIVEKEIDTAREGYIPVAFRSSILYFCVSDLSPVDPMYQFSLQWFIALFENGIDNSPSSDDLSTRLKNINEYFTVSLYQTVCRALFENHKLLFSFLLTINIMKVSFFCFFICFFCVSVFLFHIYVFFFDEKKDTLTGYIRLEMKMFFDKQYSNPQKKKRICFVSICLSNKRDVTCRPATTAPIC